jgi:folate-binding protein YgfZ
MNDSLRSWQQRAGARFAEVAGAEVARHFGDPAAEYAAVRESVGVALRSDLAAVRMWGRDPVKMLHGLVTNDVTRIRPGQGVYATMLTPKGRAIAEMRIFLRESDAPELLLILPREALQGTVDHLRKFVPPMFARWEDASEQLVVIGGYGPRAAALLHDTMGAALPAGEDAAVEIEAEGDRVLAVGTLEAGGETGFELVVPRAHAEPLLERLAEGAAGAGGRAIGFGALETLRVEAGRPRYGAELTESTIPTEAFEAIGWMPRAISFSKGCYTGQEVIVRIAHRGHVNRLLRGLLLPDGPTPAGKTPLFNPENGKESGWITTAVDSPLSRGPIALALLRRELAPGTGVRVGSVDGPEARVVELPFTRSDAS